MDNKTITSTLDIVNWFCRKAAAVGTTLDENKIQHLLFLAQIHYALKSGHFLMPSLFVCSRSGFYEPTVRVLMRFGLPLLPEPCFKTEINTFLELIWQKYAGQSGDYDFSGSLRGTAEKAGSRNESPSGICFGGEQEAFLAG